MELRRLKSCRHVLVPLLILGLLPGCQTQTTPPAAGTGTTTAKPEKAAVELPALATIKIPKDKDKMRGELEELSKLLKANDEKSKAKVEEVIGPKSDRWKKLQERLSKLEEQRKTIMDGLAKLTVPEAEFTKFKQEIEAVRTRPNAPTTLKEKAEKASTALDNYKLAWGAATQSTTQFAKPLDAATAQWKSMQDQYKAKSEKGEPTTEEQQRFADEVTKTLGNATELGLQDDGTITVGGPLNLMMQSYAAFETVRNGFWSAFEELRKDQNLSDDERTKLTLAAKDLRSKDSDFVKAASVVLKSASETLTTIALLQGLGVALGPWGIVAIAAIILLKNILDGGFDGEPGKDGSVPGTPGEKDSNSEQPGESKDASDPKVVVEDPKVDDIKVTGSPDGEWGQKFDTNDATQNLLVYLELKADRSKKHVLTVCTKETQNEDLKAIRATYQAGKLAFDKFGASGKQATGEFQADKDGKRGTFKVTWNLNKPNEDPTVVFVVD